MEFKFNFEDISDENRARLAKIGRLAYVCGWIIFAAYVAASLINVVLVLPQLVDHATIKDFAPSIGSSNLGLRRQVNIRDVRKAVLERNLFNKEGEFPEEVDPSSEEEIHQGGDIASQPCSKSNLPIELMGTIYLGNGGNSLATVQEKGYSQADVYRKGDAIIGHEQARVYEVEQKRLIINNGGRKECLELKDPERPVSEGGYASDPSKNSGGPPPPGGDCGNIVLKEDYVQKELGPDFQEILKKGRLIPNERGFKLIGVNKSSLFGKVCLNNGDILTQINDISMQEPDKGFTFYKVFQDEREIRISLLRNGTKPMTVNVRIE